MQSSVRAHPVSTEEPVFPESTSTRASALQATQTNDAIKVYRAADESERLVRTNRTVRRDASSSCRREGVCKQPMSTRVNLPGR